MSNCRSIPTRSGSPKPGKRSERHAFRPWYSICLWLVALCAFPQAAFAQLQYINSTDGTVNETVTPCTNPLVRNFTVSEIYTVADVNIGVLMSHTFRGDLQFYLRSPAGTRIQLINNIGGTRNNVNVLFDDAAANPISNHTSNNDTANAGTAVPPYQRTFRPFEALSVFDGEEANGTWRLEICDSQTRDTGTFYQSDLFITAMPATVNVAKTSSVVSDAISLANPKAIPAATVRYCITVINAGPGTAATISATDSIPANMSYVAGSILSGSTCGTAATTEDDDASDGSELDAVTASHSAGTITINRASLTNGASFAVTFAAIIN